MKPTLKAPGSKRLILKYDQLVSNFACNFNLRRYTMVSAGPHRGLPLGLPVPVVLTPDAALYAELAAALEAAAADEGADAAAARRTAAL